MSLGLCLHCSRKGVTITFFQVIFQVFCYCYNISPTSAYQMGEQGGGGGGGGGIQMKLTSHKSLQPLPPSPFLQPQKWNGELFFK